MKSWLKLGSLAVTLSLLAACSSGLQTSPGIQEPELSAQADGHIWKRVLASTDDAEEILSTGVMRLDSVDLDLGGEASGRAAVGVRFAEFNIPKGAQIQSAHLFFVPRDSQSGTALMTLQTHSHYASKTFNASSQNISSRYVDPPSVSWSVPAWNTNMTLQSPEIKSPDLKSIVQPLVNSSDITALTFIIKGSGHRVAKSFDSGTGGVPALEIFYTSPQPTKPPLANCLKANSTSPNTLANGNLQLKSLTNGSVNLGQRTIKVTGPTNSSASPIVAITGSSTLCLSGGKLTYDSGVLNDSSYWEKDRAPNAFHSAKRGVQLVNSPNTIVQRTAIDIAGDGLSIQDGSANWTFRDSYIRHVGDDVFDNDAKLPGTVDGLLVDWAYMGFSCTSKENTAPDIEIKNSLLKMKPQNWGYDDHRNEHLFPFKWDDVKDKSIKQCPLKLSNVTIYLTQDKNIFRTWDSAFNFVRGCENLTILYPNPSNKPLTDLSLYKNTAGLRSKYPKCMTFIIGSSADTTWQQRRQAWFAEHSGPGFEHIQAYK